MASAQLLPLPVDLAEPTVDLGAGAQPTNFAIGRDRTRAHGHRTGTARHLPAVRPAGLLRFRGRKLLGRALTALAPSLFGACAMCDPLRYDAGVKSSIAILSACFAATALAQFPSPTLPDEAKQISEHVWETTGFPNIIYVIGDTGTLVIDTGLGNPNGATVARIAQRLAKGPKLFVTTTHYHPEHAAGINAFPAGTILIRTAAQQRELVTEGDQTMTFFRNSPQFGPSLQGLGPLRPPDVVFDTEATVDLGGGVTVRLMFLGAGHTASDEIILIEPDSVMVTGDIVQNKVVPNVASSGGGFRSWLTVLDKLVPFNPRIVLPTHSRPGDASLITAEAAFIRDMMTRVAELKRSGVPAAEAATRLTEVFRMNYPEWAANTDWPNLNSMNGFVNRLYQETGN